MESCCFEPFAAPLQRRAPGKVVQSLTSGKSFHLSLTLALGLGSSIVTTIATYELEKRNL